jgi:hypothetical protein
MNKYTATIEFLPDQGAAVVVLSDGAGEWSGASRIECRSGRPDDLYEAGYRAASLSAHFKGGRLERYMESVDQSKQPGRSRRKTNTDGRTRLERITPRQFEVFSSACKSRIVLPTPRRAANALNIEIGTPAARCLNKRPKNWGEAITSHRWLASGGDALVFDPCSRNCPLLPDYYRKTPMNMYRPLARPAGFCTLPRGLQWDFVEVPSDMAHRRPELPVSRHRYGVISTDRPLTQDEQARFSLQPV